MMKKIAMFALAAMMTVSLAACGKAAEPKDVPGTQNAEQVGESEQAKETSIEEEIQVAASENAGNPKEAAETPDVTGAAQEVAPTLDLSGCDTFTQIIDKKFTAGMGYANEKIGDTDVFFAASGTFDNMDGNDAAIDATLLIYKDAAPFEIGKIASGGTAYPISIGSDAIYTGSNHWMCKYVIENETLKLKELAYVNYDSNGNGTYGYEKDGKDAGLSGEEAEKAFDRLVDEMMNGQVVSFSTVS